MTRAASEISECLELHQRGLNPTEIARRMGIPRPTVRDWVNGQIPRRVSGDDDHFTCPTCGHGEHARHDLGPDYAYVLGIYLGDGCISSHPRGVYRLRVTLDAKYPGILDEVASSVGKLVPSNQVARRVLPKHCVEISAYSKAWPCLLPQHGPGRKHQRSIRLQAWQWMHVEDHVQLFLRGLIHSDGCRFINTGRKGWRSPRYAFSNRSADIHAIFRDACDLLGLRWTQAGKKTTYVSRKADVARMDEFIGPKR